MLSIAILTQSMLRPLCYCLNIDWKWIVPLPSLQWVPSCTVGLASNWAPLSPHTHTHTFTHAQRLWGINTLVNNSAPPCPPACRAIKLIMTALFSQRCMSLLLYNVYPWATDGFRCEPQEKKGGWWWVREKQRVNSGICYRGWCP